MPDIQNLSSKTVKPLTLLNKTNEIVDVINEGLNSSYTETNPTLTSTEGICVWTVTHNLNTEEVSCTVYEGDDEVFAKVEITSENVITITINSNSNIVADTYSVLILAKGGVSGSVNENITVDSELSATSTNPVQNNIITAAINLQPFVECCGDLNCNNNVLSNYNNTTNYAIIPYEFYPNGKTWEMVGSFITGEDNAELTIFSGMHNNIVALYIKRNKLGFSIGSDSEFEWDSTIGDVFGTTTIEKNIKYWAKLEFTGSAYNSYLSTDGTTWSLEGSITTNHYCQLPIDLLIGYYPTSWLVQSITVQNDLCDFYIKIGNKIVWKGIDSLENKIANIYSKQFYKAGDRFFKITPIACTGFVTSSSKELQFSVVLPKQAQKKVIESITLERLEVQARSTLGKYFITWTDDIKTYYNGFSLENNLLHLSFMWTTAFASDKVTNNTPSTVEIRNTCIRFNARDN